MLLYYNFYKKIHDKNQTNPRAFDTPAPPRGSARTADGERTNVSIYWCNNLSPPRSFPCLQQPPSGPGWADDRRTGARGEPGHVTTAGATITVQKLPLAAEPRGSAQRLLLLLVAALCLKIYASEEPGCELALLLSDRDGRGPRVRPDTDTHNGQPDPNPSSDPDRCRQERGVRDSWAETPVAPYRSTVTGSGGGGSDKRGEGEEQADSHEAPQRLSEIRIVLLGERWSEKSSAGNTILGREEFDTEGEPQECVKRQGEVAGRQITVVDTPGWNVWNYDDDDDDDPQQIRQEVVRSVSLCPPGPHTLLLVIDLDSNTDWRSAEEHLELLSESVWRHTIVLFTWWYTLRHTTIEQHIEEEGEELQWLVEKCGNRYHVLNNKNRDDRTQVTELLEKIEDMVAGNYGLYFTTDIKEINTELEKYIKQKEEERQRETGESGRL
ncbi:GTPase IMAP family member 9-like [Lepisosteus oculatus]|uniref:GTPase IMAP family member 9-like n=1 Tax=Lepisosteus oculatus TaxID=7918 RepID=UPI0035F516E8